MDSTGTGNTNQTIYSPMNDTGDSGSMPPTPPVQAAPQSASQPDAQPAGQTPSTSGPGDNGPIQQFPANPNKSVKQPSVAPVTPQTTPPKPEADPAIQHAGRFYRFAEALAGGPAHKTTIDANTGETKRVQVPLSKGQIGMALALEAISGAMSGFAGGRGHGAGAAGVAGLQQGRAIQQEKLQREQQETEVQQRNLSNQAAVAKSNMQMAMNARALADADHDMHQHNVDSYAPLYKNAVELGAVSDIVDETTLHKMLQDGNAHVTQDMVIPVQVAEKIGVDGKPVLGKYGEPTYEEKYAIIKPGVKLDLPQETRDLLTKYKVPGYVNSDGQPVSLPANTQLRMQMIVDGIEKANTIRIAHAGFEGYANGQHNSLHKGTVPADITDPNISEMIGTKADKYTLGGLLGAVVSVESKGKADAVSPKGATGLGQLMPETAKQYGVKDPKDPEQNLEGSAHYLSDLIKKNDGDVRKALIAYHGKGSDGITTGEQYADLVMRRMKSAESQTASQGQLVDIDKAIDGLTDKDKHVFVQAGGIEAFTGGKPGELSAAQRMAEQGKIDPGSVGRIVNALNKIKPIDQFREEREQRELDIKDQAAIDKAGQINANKQKLDAEATAHLQSFLNLPPDFNFTDDMREMKPQELAKALQDKGVKTPNNLSSLWMAAHYRVPISSFAPRTWQKGSPEEMDQQTAESYIQQFINPDFDSTKYPARQKLRSELVSAQSRDGGAIRNAGTAVQHLQMLKQASDALQNGDIPTFNHVANWFGVEVQGDPKPTDFKAIAEKVNAEVEKVAMGGNQPYVDQLKEGGQNLSRDFGPKTVDSVIKDYTRLMYGRLKSIDDNSMAELNEHLHNVSPEVSTLFRQYGMDTPWQPAQSQTQQPVTNQGPQPRVVPKGAFAARDKNGTIVGYKDATGYHPFHYGASGSY